VTDVELASVGSTSSLRLRRGEVNAATARCFMVDPVARPTSGGAVTIPGFAL
jgi:hypothetical protein